MPSMTYRHPWTGAVYTNEADDRVRVELEGKVGYFRFDGRWVEGELRVADPHMCVLLGLAPLQPGVLASSIFGGKE